ncbi:MAG: serine/threonine protein phosphatase, partial [Christensenellaceae bacterium]
MSDIHGEMETFKEALNVVDLCNTENRLILLGDYIGHNYTDTEMFTFIKNLQD